MTPNSAAVYETLETVTGPASSFDLAATAGLGRSAAYDALETLAGWNLAVPDGRGRWLIVRATCLGRLAEAWGVLDSIRTIIARHRTERADYRRALRIPDNPYADVALADWTAAQNAPPPPETLILMPAPDPLATALELLQRELGAQSLLAH